MVSTNDLRKGIVLRIDGELFSVLDYQHHKPGKGRAVVKTKLRNVKKNTVIDKTFTADEKVEDVEVENKKAQYMYKDNDSYAFMDSETFEQFSVGKDFLGDGCNYLKDEMVCETLYCDGELVSIVPPMFVTMEITYTEHGLKGDTVSATFKPAEVETGYTVSVPLFVNIGDKIKIDTRSGKYVERV